MKNQEESESNDISRAAEVLKKGGVVIFPTDTVYGIGCTVTSKLGEARIKRIKHTHQQFPVLIDSFQELHKLAVVTGPAQMLIDKYWPGPLTLLLESKHNRQKIGIRMPKDENIRELISKVGSPIFATSANFHTSPTPKTYEELDSKFKELADFVLIGECTEKEESTIVDVTVVPHKIIRLGAAKLHEAKN